MLIGVLGLRINRYWFLINEAHRVYSYSRWLSAIAIETELKLTDVGLASIENKWKKHNDFSDSAYYPFDSIPELAEHKIKDRHSIEGYDSIGGVIKIINILWWAIIFISLTSVCLSLFFAFIKNQNLY